jgi:hypothetical protein
VQRHILAKNTNCKKQAAQKSTRVQQNRPRALGRLHAYLAAVLSKHATQRSINPAASAHPSGVYVYVATSWLTPLHIVTLGTAPDVLVLVMPAELLVCVDGLRLTEHLPVAADTNCFHNILMSV